MSKIELPTITSGYNLSTINNNFQKIEDALNEEVLYRKGYVGEPNEMQTNLDMNGKEILNVVVGSSPGSLATKGYVDQEVAEERAYVDQQLVLVDVELDTKYDKSGGPLFGGVQMQGNRISGLPNANQPSEPATYAQLLQVESPGDSLLRNDLASATGATLIGVEPKTVTAPMLNLQQWLDDEVVNLRTRFGVSSSATPRSNSDNLQAAYDELSAAGGGRLRLPASRAPYFFAPSSLIETYDNYGAAVPASGACISARAGVLLEGDGIGKSIFQVMEGDLVTSCIHAISPNGGGFRNLSLRGNTNKLGAGHGVFNVNQTADPMHQICQNWLIDWVEVSDVGSYGIGINNGDITNVRVSNIYVHNVGADGIDTKQRGPRKKNIGLDFVNILVDGFGHRLTGQAGLDLHGVGQVANLTVRNMAQTLQVGFRYRTLTDNGNEGENARMSRASNIIIENVPSNDDHQGILIGSPDCLIQGAVARGVTDGFIIAGNSVGVPDRSMISNAHAIDCARYGYVIGTGVNDATLETAYAINCNTGFRNQGTRTTYIRAIPFNCTTKFSTATVAQPTERMIASDTTGMSENGTSSQVTLEPRGEGADIEVRIKSKGNSRTVLMDGVGNRKVQVDQSGVAFNGSTPTGKMTLNAAATDLATTTALVNQIRSGLIADGLAQ